MEYLDGEKVLWKTQNFVIRVPNKPFVSREEGGHVIIQGIGDKYRYNSKLDFSKDETIEEHELCWLFCNAYKEAMKKRNIEIIRFNFFEAGNWAWKEDIVKPYFHEHIFGRTVDAKYQKFPEAPYMPDRKTGFYDEFQPLNDDDIETIKNEMIRIEKSIKIKIHNS